MVHLARSWQLDIDRGPECLFVRLSPPISRTGTHCDLADRLWDILSRHFTYRVVLEMDDVERLPSRLIGELVQLQRWIQAHGGMLRLCGLSDTCQQTLDACHLSGALPNYHSRVDAVRGHSRAPR